MCEYECVCVYCVCVCVFLPERTSPSMLLAVAYTSLTSPNPAQPMRATLTELGSGGVRMETAVTTPSVPSDPMNSCFTS